MLIDLLCSVLIRSCFEEDSYNALDFRGLHKKKSRGVKSVDLGGYSMASLVPIQRCEKT